MKRKVISLKTLARWARILRKQNQSVVLTNGCFDILHLGHIRYLTQARELGDALVVAVNGDKSVRALKGEGRPINPATERAEVIAALGAVDFVVIFDDDRATKVIRAIKPSIYVKGGDYTAGSLNAEEVEALKEVGSKIRILPLVPNRSTSKLLRRICA